MAKVYQLKSMTTAKLKWRRFEKKAKTRMQIIYIIKINQDIIRSSNLTVLSQILRLLAQRNRKLE
jgi:hypothetical protein